MHPYITGSMIKKLREEHCLTQAELAERLSVSDKTVSKWETAKGYPDITLLEPIARVFWTIGYRFLCACLQFWLKYSILFI